MVGLVVVCCVLKMAVKLRDGILTFASLDGCGAVSFSEDSSECHFKRVLRKERKNS